MPENEGQTNPDKQQTAAGEVADYDFTNSSSIARPATSLVVRLFREQHTVWPENPALRTAALDHGLRIFTLQPFFSKVPEFEKGRKMPSARFKISAGMTEQLEDISSRLGGVEQNAIIRAAVHYALFDRYSPAYNADYAEAARLKLGLKAA